MPRRKGPLATMKDKTVVGRLKCHCGRLVNLEVNKAGYLGWACRVDVVGCNSQMLSRSAEGSASVFKTAMQSKKHRQEVLRLFQEHDKPADSGPKTIAETDEFIPVSDMERQKPKDTLPAPNPPQPKQATPVPNAKASNDLYDDLYGGNE